MSASQARLCSSSCTSQAESVILPIGLHRSTRKRFQLSDVLKVPGSSGLQLQCAEIVEPHDVNSRPVVEYSVETAAPCLIRG